MKRHLPRGAGRALAALLLCCAFATQALAQAWSLSTEQRRAYLYYYAPLILKQANEANTAALAGHDWITNFDFDFDHVFSTNRASWQDRLGTYVLNSTQATFADWRIRPTLYTALIEFMPDNGPNKSLILLYHVYHAQEEHESIHDWERVEVRINNVNGTPGSGVEAVAYVLVTTHSVHAGLKPGNAKLQFTPKTATGYHPIIWQAQWDNDDDFTYYKNELRTVVTPWADSGTTPGFGDDINCASCPAKVTINAPKDTVQRVHYAFVPKGDDALVALWGATPLSHANANSQAAKTAAQLNGWTQVKRITYELQDIAEIVATQANTASCNNTDYEREWAPYDQHWDTEHKQTSTFIRIDTPLKTEAKGTLVPGSKNCRTPGDPIEFVRWSLDSIDKDDAQGYAYKHWFWGAYRMNVEDGGDTDGAFKGDDVNSKGSDQSRFCPGKDADTRYWCQNDYYVHSGDDPDKASHGKWLPEGWHKKKKGGFDGRWVQLFDDNP